MFPDFWIKHLGWTMVSFTENEKPWEKEIEGGLVY